MRVPDFTGSSIGKTVTRVLVFSVSLFVIVFAPQAVCAREGPRGRQVDASPPQGGLTQTDSSPGTERGAGGSPPALQRINIHPPVIPPPPPPGGWGTDCTSWITYSNPWSSGEMIYDPEQGSGGSGWVICPDCDPVTWPRLGIELWVEMECVLTWDHTTVDIHRASDYSDIWLQFDGTSRCNSGQFIVATPPTGGDLDILPFVEDMFGRSGPAHGTDIPLTWDYRLDGGGWLPMGVYPDGRKYFRVDRCDHSFSIRVLVDMVYHQENGYYRLGGPGATLRLSSPL